MAYYISLDNEGLENERNAPLVEAGKPESSSPSAAHPRLAAVSQVLQNELLTARACGLNIPPSLVPP